MSWTQRLGARVRCARLTWGLCTPCAVIISLGLPLDLLRRRSTLAHEADRGCGSGECSSFEQLPATGSIENP
jgi:hypothetical protein